MEALLLGGERPLLRTLDAIFARPDRELRVRHELVLLSETRDLDPDLTLGLMGDPEATCPAGFGPRHFETPEGPHSFRLGWDRRPEVSHDTSANRALLLLIADLQHALRGLESATLSPSDAARLRRAKRLLTRARAQLDALGLRRQGPPAGATSTVLDRDPRYLEVRHAAQRWRAWLRAARTAAPQEG